MIWAIVGAGVAGLAVGAFLNVVAHRVPRGLSVIRPPSACPSCQHQIRARDNIPVLSWILLRGRCRDCGAPISVRYPIVEAGTAALFAATVAVIGLAWVLPAYLWFAGVVMVLTLTLGCSPNPQSGSVPGLGSGYGAADGRGPARR